MTEGFDGSYAARQLARRSSVFRRAVKAAYLASTLREVEGASLDFGCGAGQLLERLPSGSTGLEANPVLVEDLSRRGLDVRLYDGLADGFRFSGVEAGRYRTFIASHVLEHFGDADEALRLMASGCQRLGVGRLVVVLPGLRGYRHDATHRTFVDAAYLQARGLASIGPYRMVRSRSFPVDRAWFGRLFVYNESIFVWQR